MAIACRNYGPSTKVHFPHPTPLTLNLLFIPFSGMKEDVARQKRDEGGKLRIGVPI
jgi:hypothetical protein